MRSDYLIVAQALMSAVITHCRLMSAKNPADPASQADIVAVFTGNHLEHATFQHGERFFLSFFSIETDPSEPSSCCR